MNDQLRDQIVNLTAEETLCAMDALEKALSRGGQGAEMKQPTELVFLFSKLSEESPLARCIFEDLSVDEPSVELVRTARLAMLMASEYEELRSSVSDSVRVATKQFRAIDSVLLLATAGAIYLLSKCIPTSVQENVTVEFEKGRIRTESHRVIEFPQNDLLRLGELLKKLRNDPIPTSRTKGPTGTSTSVKLKVLFLAANPLGSQLQLDKECREITAKIRSSDFRDSLQFITRWAVRPDDLQQTLLEVKPHILHFSGHGTKGDEIVLMDLEGKANPVSMEAMKHLLTTLKDNIRLVVLNACYSRAQAEAIVSSIDCAVGMRQAIGDEAAIHFAGSFYRAIGFGRSVKEAFELGLSSLKLEGIQEDETPQLLSRAGVNTTRLCLLASDADHDAG